MSPHLQPASLYRLALSAASRHVDAACTNIFLEHGCYGNEDCMAAMRDLQAFLVSQLPNTVFEQLAEDRNTPHNSQLLWSKDPRIKLGVFLHPSITRFNVDCKVNELMQQQGDELDDDLFWGSHLGRLSNLVYLNMRLITTDKLLMLVGKCCPKLEVINIVSRVKQEPATTSALMPGISLFKFCVTDLGLRALRECRRLRHVTLNRVVSYRSSASGEAGGISLEGLRQFVRDLPSLEYISFNSMGKLIDAFDPETEPPLKVGFYSETDPAYMDIGKLVRVCPRTRHICLSVPASYNGGVWNNQPQQHEVGPPHSAAVAPLNAIMRAITDAELPLKILELHYFPYSDPFKDLMRVKGEMLEELHFRAHTPLNSTHIRLIGEHCPNLVRLHLKELGPETANAPPYSFAADVLRKRLFSHVKWFHLSGRRWHAHSLLPLLLASAKDVKQLTLLNMSNATPLDGALLRTLQYNPLRSLQTLNLYGGCFLSLRLVRQLVFDCPSLKDVSFLQYDGVEPGEVDALKAEVEAKNLDVDLRCLELLDMH